MCWRFCLVVQSSLIRPRFRERVLIWSGGAGAHICINTVFSASAGATVVGVSAVACVGTDAGAFLSERVQVVVLDLIEHMYPVDHK